MKHDNAEFARLRARIENLEEVCAEAHQFAGAMGAPVRLLDLFWHAAQGRTVTLEGFAPVRTSECEEITTLQQQLDVVRRVVAVGPAAAELGRLGGSRTSRAKAKAARANGRKGGRPRKIVTA
jgi:hypothetical protein